MMLEFNLRSVAFCLLTLFAVADCAAQSASVRRSSNLREKPSTSSAIVGSLNRGDVVTLTSATPTTGYFSVKTADGKLGWVLAKNVTVGATVLRAQRLALLQPTGSAEFTPSCSDPAFPSADPTPIDSECGLAGVGKAADQAQNEQKNNFCATGPSRSITITDLEELQKKVQDGHAVNFGNSFNAHPLSKIPGAAKDRAPLVALGEGTQVTLTGFVADAAAEDPETVNCSLGTKSKKDAPLHDIHVSIVDEPNADKCTGVVAEMIPHHRPDAWTPNILIEVKGSKRQVRVSGNLMFDSSHTPCIDGAALNGDPSRASLWEVHPIYKFEVCSTSDCSAGDGWVPLESWRP
jgi:hypothetical protein